MSKLVYNVIRRQAAQCAMVLLSMLLCGYITVRYLRAFWSRVIAGFDPAISRKILETQGTDLNTKIEYKLVHSS